jgi:hypothetical protein
MRGKGRENMKRESIRVDLSKLVRKAGNHVASMLNELEGSTRKGSALPAWSARFIAVGGKRAASRR